MKRKWVIVVDDEAMGDILRQGIPNKVLMTPDEWDSDMSDDRQEVFKGAVIISAFKNLQFFVRNVEGKAFKLKVKDPDGNAWIDIERREKLDR